MITTHRVWKYGDNINTDVIFPGKYTYTVDHNRSELAQHALEDLDPTFASQVQPGDIIVAGRNWGNGSSREQAVTSLVAAGVYAVVAISFARIYYRNAINNGLFPIECAAIIPRLKTGDVVQIDMQQHVLIYASQRFTFRRFPEAIQQIIQAGGLIKALQNSER
ncbi:MAG: 3-isopropylmalate dehydratase [Phototrophicales bacterium]|nr:MAG: 3-isopropylmalate dehydratase [Phototrophicales bacterium]